MRTRRWVGALWLVLSCGPATSTVDGGAPTGGGTGATGGGGGGSSGGGGGGSAGGGSAACATPTTPVCGSVSFSSPASFPASPGPVAIELADLTGDGVLDAVSAHTLRKVSIMPGACDGTFGAAQTSDAGDWAEDVVAADFNGDGRPDVAASSGGNNALWVYLNLGGGQLGAPLLLAAGNGPWGIAAGDLSGDGKPDLVAANNYSGTLSLFISAGDGTFAPVRTLTSGGQGALDVAIGDLNKDGRPDLAVAIGSGTGAIGLFFSRGDGGYSPMVSKSVTPLGNAPSVLALGDLNGDGWLDVASAHSSSGQLGVFLGAGDGGLLGQRSYDAGSGLEALRLADLNGDGALDAVLTNGTFNGSSEQTVSVLLGNGDGTFRGRLQFPAGPNPRALAIADVNGDGKKDLVVGVHTTHVLSVLTNSCVP